MSVEVTNVSKCFRVFDNPSNRFKQIIIDSMRSVRSENHSKLYHEYWALKDINFQVSEGEAVAIIGRNGAGKSTLLQIIAGTVTPTLGNICISGRVTALLELGSGFNPEFTGRENIYHNGQILGLKSHEIRAKFDEIAAFADIGEYINQPVKTYSSGMIMRLAFAVQTAVEPKILIVDEALSVGDVFFQAKCMKRIKGLIDNGVTLLFVSHDIGSVKQICSKAIFLRNGEQIAYSDVSSVANLFMDETYNFATQFRGNSSTNGNVKKDVSAPNEADNGLQLTSQNLLGHEKVQSCLVEQGNADPSSASNDFFSDKSLDIISVAILKNNNIENVFEFDDEVEIYVNLFSNLELGNVNVAIQIKTVQGIALAYYDTRLLNKVMDLKKNTRYLYRFKTKLNLMHGNYILACGVNQPPSEINTEWIVLDLNNYCYSFTVLPRTSGMIDGYFAPTSTLIVTEMV